MTSPQNERIQERQRHEAVNHYGRQRRVEYWTKFNAVPGGRHNYSAITNKHEVLLTHLKNPDHCINSKQRNTSRFL